jgi:hypothetical protein
MDANVEEQVTALVTSKLIHVGGCAVTTKTDSCSRSLTLMLIKISLSSLRHYEVTEVHRLTEDLLQTFGVDK